MDGFYPSTPDFALHVYRRSTEYTNSDCVTAAAIDNRDYQHWSHNFKGKASFAAAQVETLTESTEQWSTPGPWDNPHNLLVCLHVLIQLITHSLTQVLLLLVRQKSWGKPEPTSNVALVQQHTMQAAGFSFRACC